MLLLAWLQCSGHGPNKDSLPLISVAAVDGAAIGGGAELCTSCDFRVAGPNSSIRFVQVKVRQCNLPPAVLRLACPSWRQHVRCRGERLFKRLNAVICQVALVAVICRLCQGAYIRDRFLAFFRNFPSVFLWRVSACRSHASRSLTDERAALRCLLMCAALGGGVLCAYCYPSRWARRLSKQRQSHPLTTFRSRVKQNCREHSRSLQV